jgi:hypothetical protein
MTQLGKGGSRARNQRQSSVPSCLAQQSKDLEPGLKASHPAGGLTLGHPWEVSSLTFLDG